MRMIFVIVALVAFAGVFGYGLMTTPRLVNPAEASLSWSDQNRLASVGIDIPTEDFVTTKTVTLLKSDGGSCEVPAGSVLVAEFHGSASVDVAILSNNDCPSGHFRMSRIGWVISFG